MRSGAGEGRPTHYILFVIELASRQVVIAGITTNPHEGWMLQIARNLLDADRGLLRDGGVLLIDWGATFSEAFRSLLIREGIKVIRLPPQSPSLNAYAERFVGSIKDECLSQIIPIGQGMLRRALGEYMAHYHMERNHQGIGNALIAPEPPAESKDGAIARRRRFGGMLNYYERCAA